MHILCATASLCNLCVLCVSVVNECLGTTTTETQRTQRLHREELTVFGLPRFNRGKLDDEARVFPFLAFNLDRAAEIANDAEAYTQTQTSTACFASSSEERIEYLCEIFTLDSSTIVIKLNAHVLTYPARSDSEYLSFDRIARLRLQCVMRITNHVNHDLPET